MQCALAKKSYLPKLQSRCVSKNQLPSRRGGRAWAAATAALSRAATPPRWRRHLRAEGTECI
eukprot:2635990-Pyramimonas_sp.AAC.1